MSDIVKALEKEAVVILDGGLATELQAYEEELNHPLWTARLVERAPEAIKAAHQAFFEAGANIATTATYQASVEGFVKAGHKNIEARTLMRKAVFLAKQARTTSGGDQEKWLAGSIGPYGAFLADGSEYRGDYELSDLELYAFHAERFALLVEAGVDLIFFETIPNFVEVKTLLKLLEKFPDQKACLTVSLKDPYHMSDGTALENLQTLLDWHPQIIAYGVNCCPAAWGSPALDTMRPSALKPFIVYPNLGGAYNPETKQFEGQEETSISDWVTDWYDKGARFIGGCCGTTAQDIREVRQSLDAYIKNKA
ncbi:homocysteine S-methyltransferase [Aerococcus sp. UMB10185]|uniref:homocysteine S-methyltransferase n=1 Tax=unclassified Aerococcus TaxID=2618060 RepID=UPI002550F184|nr:MULTISPECIES: homocysteine S-methyltransferase [unclassified Aerococcus]MDK6234357.1 homocysteine S-methyltransferase [Aerococcus sp. UMB10185]MDK6856190.1 homocysteine S-methyltransferase [Aerococcus sp. UMB7533]